MPLTILSLTDKPSWTMKHEEPKTEWSQLEEADVEYAMNKSQNTWIVDFQYYSYDADHIFPKEISVLNCFNGVLGCSFFAKSPHIDIDADNTFQYQFNLHKTPWNYGDVEDWVARLKFIVGPIHWIYVKGAVKRDFLIKHGFQNVVDMDESGCPSLSKLYSENKSVKFTKCDLHRNAWGLCSLSNVYILRKWFNSTK